MSLNSIFLPYLGVYSIHLKNRLKKFLGKIYFHVDFKIVLGANKSIGSLFPFKDRVLGHVYSSVVCKFTCSSCQATYYCKTLRHFIVRCREHLGINKRGNSSGGSWNFSLGGQSFEELGVVRDSCGSHTQKWFR